MVRVNSTYTFGDLITLSGASKNEVSSWVQRGLIRPDIQDTTGTGTHRTFGFLDVFEACVARKLNQLPGGIPLVTLSLILDVLRLATESAELTGAPWGHF